MRILIGVLSVCCVVAAERPPAPSWALQSSTGKRVSVESLRGKVVVLNFWATWCKPCRDEIQVLQRIRRDYESDDIEIIGVAMDGRGWPTVTPFLVGRGIDYPILLGTPTVAKQYGGLASLPYTVFIDRLGRVAATSDIALKEDSFRKILAALAREP